MPSRDVNLLFRAFADPTRLRILHLVRHAEICVGDLVKVLRVPQPRVSRHLAYLRRAGLVVARRDGLWSYYALRPSKGRFHRSLLACLESCFREVPALEADAKRFRQIRRSVGQARRPT